MKKIEAVLAAKVRLLETQQRVLRTEIQGVEAKVAILRESANFEDAEFSLCRMAERWHALRRQRIQKANLEIARLKAQQIVLREQLARAMARSQVVNETMDRLVHDCRRLNSARIQDATLLQRLCQPQ